MFVHQMRRAGIAEDGMRQFDLLLTDLPDGFRRILGPTRLYAASLFGLPKSLTENVPAGGRRPEDGLLRTEIIATDANLFVLRLTDATLYSAGKTDSSDLQLTLHSVGSTLASDELVRLIAHLEERFSTKFDSLAYFSPRFEEMKKEGRTPPQVPSTAEMAAARVLEDRATRTLAVAIKQSSGLLVGDLDRQLPAGDKPRTAEIRKALEGSGIISAETVVICRKTSAQVCKVPDPAMLVEAGSLGWKCACGNAINSERTDIALSITDRGITLLDKSHWFTIILISNLVALGISSQRVLIDQVSGGDEMDCIADINGELVLFELKDKEFNLGNAYSFGAKIGIIRPGYSVIVTTEYVGKDAKDHFAKARAAETRNRQYPWQEQNSDGTSMIYIEGIDSLNSELTQLISKVNMFEFDEILRDVLPSDLIPPGRVLKWLNDRLTTSNSRGLNQSSPKRKRQRQAQATAGFAKHTGNEMS